MTGLQADVSARAGTLRLRAALDVHAGEVLAVVGPNGAGKSTLLACLAGLVALDGGSVRLGGRVLEDPARGVRVPPEDRAVGLCFQQHLLFPHLSVRENVAFGLRARGVPVAAARREADVWLERVGLGGRGRTRPAALSGGQGQRVALARALATRPELLLLDEPLAALDLQGRQAVRSLLRSRLADFDGPCVLVTHDPLEAFALADRLVVLEAGAVTQVGTPAEIARRPRSAWAARLAGVNLYRGEGRGHTVTIDGTAVVAAGEAHGPTFAVVHPRAVALHRRPPEGSPRNVWAAVVDAVDAQGDRVRVSLQGPLPITAEVTPAAVSALDLGAGGQVWVTVKASEVETYPA